MSYSDIAVCIRNLSKAYTIVHAQEKHATLAETIISRLRNPLRRARTETFWALKDVSFDIKKGEVVGIIGRNGAGKSTLLKILSRITEPTTGEVELFGRVGSLLEVGTGFHPELTGRENVYLNGAILGMAKSEIKKQFDAIVDFAGVEQFLDTPVKRYSSGMYVRLAFAVAAHLNPEILIVDEVLAVGDAEFQKKCLEKMKDVSDQGRTVLFVSHNLNAVEELCSIALVLERGQVKVSSSDPSKAVREYLRGASSQLCTSWTNPGGQFDNPYFVPHRFYLANGNGETLHDAQRNDAEIWIHIEGEVKTTDPALTIGYALFDESGTEYYWSYPTDSQPDKWPSRSVGKRSVRTQLPKRLFNEGTYRIELIGGLSFREWIFKPTEAVPSIQLLIQGGLSDSPLWMARRPGLIAPVLEWSDVE